MPATDSGNARQRASRTLEALARASPELSMDQARENFRQLSDAEQFKLVKEVVIERRSEYVRLIKNVVTVEPGLRRRRNAAGSVDIHHEPCAIFFVRRKWRADSNENEDRRVPAELLVHCQVDGERVLCAIPTDVQRQDRLLGTVAQARNGIYAQGEDDYAEYGAICCAVQDDSDTRFAVSAIHVISPAAGIQNGGLSSEGIEFMTESTSAPPQGNEYLQATDVGGRLVPEPAMSFDVQLAEVLNEDLLRTALRGMEISADRPFILSDSELVALHADGRRMLIMVPENHPDHLDGPRQPIEAMLSGGEVSRMVSYPFDAPGKSIGLNMALELQIAADSAATEPGDSGCPVLVPLNSGLMSLVGMHIGGNNEHRTSTVIPAWRFLNPACFIDVGGTAPASALRVSTDL